MLNRTQSSSVFSFIANAKNVLREILSRRGPFCLSDYDVCVLRSSLPYVLRDLSGSDKYIVLNRSYDPLGAVRTRETQSQDYSTLSKLHLTLPRNGLHKVILARDDLRFFNDASAPWNTREAMVDYYKKLTYLEALMTN